MKPIVIIGAGPAGCSAALSALRHTPSVLLVDKAAAGRDKVCGGCLSARALAELDAHGLGSLPAESGAEATDRLQLSVLGSILEVELPAGFALSRRVLDRGLQRECEAAGVELRLSCEARLGSRPGEVVLGGERVEAEAIIVATGLAPLAGLDALVGAPHTATNARLGLGGLMAQGPGSPQQGTISMAVSSFGYVGRVRVEDAQVDLAAAVDPRSLRGRSRGETVDAVLREAGIEDGLDGQSVSGTPKLNRSRARFGSERLLLIGDAGGYLEPFTGEGISWALKSGRKAGEVLAGGWKADLDLEWSKSERGRRRDSERTCAMLSKVLRRPHLLKSLIPVLRALPFVLRPLVARAQGAV